MQEVRKLKFERVGKFIWQAMALYNKFNLNMGPRNDEVELR